MRFPFYKQLDGMDCGHTCLRMIAKYYGKKFSTIQERLRDLLYTGLTLPRISIAGEELQMTR